MPLSSQFRTDLALEAADTGDDKLPEGVTVEQQSSDDILKTLVRITTEGASQRLGRPCGNYITLEGALSSSDKLIELLSKELSVLLPEGAVLVVGLGNRQITPDTLGSDVADKIIATMHIAKAQRERLGLADLRDVCVLAPGAMGQTGLEVASLISMVTAKLNFSAVICVDALAARSMQRLGTTIQLSDSGICPGSGVHNKREEISKQTVGIPVLSVGVPTVVDVATLVNDLCTAPADIERQDMIVTPRDIDVLSQQAATILATAINISLQNKFDAETVRQLMA